MKVFNCILGVFSILGSVYCIFFPGRTFLNGGWVVTMLLGAIGICYIFEYFSNRNKKGEKDEKKHKYLIVNGVIGLVIGIVCAVASLLATFSILARFILDIMILMLFVFWLLYSGVNSIIRAVNIKKKGSKSWILSLIMGILVILTGFYSLFHLIFTAFTIGYLIGFVLMIYGIRLIASIFEQHT